MASTSGSEIGSPSLESDCKKFYGVGKRIPKDVRRFCGMCRQHGVREETRGHICPFKVCTCNKCELVRRRRSIMSTQIRLRREQDKKFQRTTDLSKADFVPWKEDEAKKCPDVNMCYLCQKCKNHGVLQWKRDHKKSCEYANCKCDQCNLIDSRRALDKHIKKNRGKKMIETVAAAEPIAPLVAPIASLSPVTVSLSPAASSPQADSNCTQFSFNSSCFSENSMDFSSTVFDSICTMEKPLTTIAPSFDSLPVIPQFVFDSSPLLDQANLLAASSFGVWTPSTDFLGRSFVPTVTQSSPTIDLATIIKEYINLQIFSNQIQNSASVGLVQPNSFF